MIQFDVEGLLVETCQCGPGCVCCEPEGETRSTCKVKAAWRIDKGNAGQTPLAGLSVVAVYDQACFQSGAPRAGSW